MSVTLGDRPDPEAASPVAEEVIRSPSTAIEPVASGDLLPLAWPGPPGSTIDDVRDAIELVEDDGEEGANWRKDSMNC